MVDTGLSVLRQDCGSTRGLRVVSGGAVIVLLLLASTANAATDPRFSISVGAFFTDRDTKTSISGEAGAGTDVDLEDDLGLDNSDTVFRVDAYWRFAEKHRLDFNAFDLSRSGSKQIERDFTWGDTTYPVNTVVDATLDLAIYKVAYTWEFLKRDRSFLGATLGLYVMDVDSTLTGSLLSQNEAHDLTAPLPVLGLRGEYRFADRWSLRSSGEIFFFEQGDFDGLLYDLFAGLDFSITDNIAIGVGINGVRLDLDVSKDRFQGNMDWEYQGALTYLKFDF